MRDGARAASLTAQQAAAWAMVGVLQQEEDWRSVLMEGRSQLNEGEGRKAGKQEGDSSGTGEVEDSAVHGRGWRGVGAVEEFLGARMALGS